MNGEKYLVTTDNWFYAPDGKKYRAAWGKITVLEDSILGLKTNRNSTNWFLKIGSEDNHIIAAGCQIYYAVRCEEIPNTDTVNEFQYNASNQISFIRPSEIYLCGY